MKPLILPLHNRFAWLKLALAAATCAALLWAAPSLSNAQVAIPDIPPNMQPGAIHNHNLQSINIRANHPELVGPVTGNPARFGPPQPTIEYEPDDGLLLQMIETEDGHVELKRDGFDVLIK
ncbi:MAG: hypothetical protein KC476_08475 [Cyanobacteria bacterium HKST-UBA06]|nr:hypothetical protein [Cyanobacteria bacterium HKST-UBA06]